MEKTLKVTESSSLYRKIDALKLSHADRAKAIESLALAENLVDGCLWLLTRIGAISVELKSEPKLRHQ